MKVVFIGAHPDDIEFGCAGTIRKMKQSDAEISWIIMTSGENDINKDKALRLKELKAASKFQHVDNVICFDCPDGNVQCNSDLVDRIKSVICDIEPDIVFVQYWDDRHQDHRNTAYAVRSACWGNYNLVYFRSLSSLNFEPTIFVDISEYIEDKHQALELYVSQVQKYKNRTSSMISTVLAIDKINGGNIHTNYAEGFVPLNCVWTIEK